MGFWKGTKKVLKNITGVQAYQDRKEAKALNEENDKIIQEIEEGNKREREATNKALENYGTVVLTALKNNVGKFLMCLDYIGANSKLKEYDILENVEITPEKIDTMRQLDMTASSALGTTVAAGGAAAVALTGVPSLVTGAVSSLCAASTGTAISSLSGAAATNATLAWLGGGSLATGGGGMAAGAAVLSTITWTVTGVFAVASAGIICSAYYSKKLTQATQQNAEVKKWASEVRAGWTLMNSIRKRADELKKTVLSLQNRADKLMEKFEPLIYDFESNNPYHIKIFQQNALLAKTISEIAQVPLMDSEGNLTQKSWQINTSAQKLLNTDLKL